MEDRLSETLQDRLILQIAQAIKEHFILRPEPSRTAVYEVLQALAFNAAVTLHGTDKDPEAVEYFMKRLLELLKERPPNGQTQN